MRKYKLYSTLIFSICVLISLSIVLIAFEEYPKVIKAQDSLKTYQERMSSPVDALNPDISGSYTGELIIPKLGVDCTIRSDTVNAYNAVYHYPESVKPGQPGECGILGHRTTYSGLFKNISSLEIGDKVIVKDSTLKKEYTYSVTSNGNDIRWDYKTNPVKFAEEGEACLLIITCYPPGKKEAAYIVHCKLVSTTDA